jgi:cytoskeletal protein RodZ
MTKICPKCNQANADSAGFCQNCGEELPEPTSVPPKSGGTGGWWSKQSSVIKALVILVPICCIGLIVVVGLVGMYSPDKTNSSTSLATNTSTSTTPATNTASSSSSSSDSSSSSSSSGVAVVISYSGEWSGAIADSSGTRSIEGTGSETISLDGVDGAVAANAQKRDSGSGTLTISLTNGGSTLKTSSTSAQYGVASVSDYI